LEFQHKINKDQLKNDFVKWYKVMYNIDLNQISSKNNNHEVDEPTKYSNNSNLLQKDQSANDIKIEDVSENYSDRSTGDETTDNNIREFYRMYNEYKN
jgi:hypothetical protein